MMHLPDIYFLPEYGKLYEDIEKGKFEQVTFKTDCGSVYYQFIKRPIDVVEGQTYYDLIVPYGYGGPIILHSTNKTVLVEEFCQFFSEYSRKNYIVSEFVRFHPILKNHKDFDSMYNVQYFRKTAATNLQVFGDPLYGEFTKKCRYKAKACKKIGAIAEFDFSGQSLKDFYKIYISTMDRNNASEFYYFHFEYFESIFKSLKNNAFIVNISLYDKIIASGLYLVFGKYVHAHLSGTLADYLKHSPANLLRAEVAKWGHKQGLLYFHHGGGCSNAEDDGLYKFKKSFSKNTSFDFYVGTKIWNQSVYKTLEDRVRANYPGLNESFFPIYRFKR